MSKTRTGGFSIGFRRLGSDWQKDLGEVIAWAKEHGFEALDLLRDGATAAKEVASADLRIGSVDLLEGQQMLSPEPKKRKDAVARNAAHIEACAAGGPVNHFVVMLPERSELSPAENFGYMVESYSELAPVLETHQAHLVIEGWPGPGALCCTPESCRAFFKACPSGALGINYDPSHLIRLGIDPLRFLREFANRVYHVHAKDTELLDEGLYEHGYQLPPVFAKPVRYGGTYWRYTLPGHGVTRWTEVFRILAGAGYQGCVSVELEDANFNGTPEGERFGLLQSLRYLEGC